jgi:hypothetical protein
MFWLCKGNISRLLGRFFYEQGLFGAKHNSEYIKDGEADIMKSAFPLLSRMSKAIQQVFIQKD